MALAFEKKKTEKLNKSQKLIALAKNSIQILQQNENSSHHKLKNNKIIKNFTQKMEKKNIIGATTARH